MSGGASSSWKSETSGESGKRSYIVFLILTLPILHSHASPRERRLSSRTQQLEVDVEDLSEAPADSRRHHRYAFARPTNYRRRRPISEVHEEIIGGSASSLISPGSFVRIGGQEGQAEVERGRGAVQIQHALPPRPHNAVAAGKSGNDSCTRHRSPPPRARTKPAQLGRSASERSNWNVPPAGQSPSAGRGRDEPTTIRSSKRILAPCRRH
jgi:hypothetical protein